MVPICRDTGSIIAFGGRQMDADQGGPKYLNSPETPIYSKGRTLYGLNLTKSQIQKADFAVLVEGYFDFAQVFQSQAAPAVASCGTALTAPQAQLLRRFTSKVVLSFDPDAAGQGAAVRSCELLVSEGFDVNVVVLDKGEDPDTFIRKLGGDQYRARLRTSQPYLEYLLDQAAKGLNLASDHGRNQLLGKMLPIAARIPDAAGRDQFGDRIAHKARITEDVVRAEIRKAAVNRQTTVTTRELPSFGQLKEAEKALIWGLINNTKVAVQALAELDADDLADVGRPARAGTGGKSARRALGSLTLDAFAASKYGGRPAGDENCRCREIASSPRRMRPRAQTAQMGTRACGNQARNRSPSRTRHQGIRTRDRHPLRRLLAVAVQLDRDLN